MATVASEALSLPLVKTAIDAAESGTLWDHSVGMYPVSYHDDLQV
jgi:hypothetical protein